MGSGRQSDAHQSDPRVPGWPQVAVVGMGGVGSVAAEMLTRCGIGRLLMYGGCKGGGMGVAGCVCVVGV